ncbi:SHOCT domain-containing protein [Kitasatospora griseola]|uniref:SHOCT domain-containing protein n=1 Tax=Kitasatospora griseola TaxID=2064 RepID=UPI0016711074|nr:SHOCT domain-containing protein [Kitasatospora griseola]
MMYWNDNGMNGWGIGLMMLSILVFLGLLIAAAVVLLHHLRPVAQHSATRRPDAEQVLAERLARGEIDPDEYRRRLEVLREGTGPGAS